jgi:hypothetical protein
VLWGDGAWANQEQWGGAGQVITGTPGRAGDPAFVAPEHGNYHIGLASAALDWGISTSVSNDVDGDPRPLGRGPDIRADETGIIVAKHAAPVPTAPGARLTYTLSVVNVSGELLTATITDSLPAPVTVVSAMQGTAALPSGEAGITWTAQITPTGFWTEGVVVIVAADYTGLLTNVVEATTEQGAMGSAAATTLVGSRVYLPLVLREEPPAVG